MHTAMSARMATVARWFTAVAPRGMCPAGRRPGLACFALGMDECRAAQVSLAIVLEPGSGMNTETSRIRDQLRRAILGGAWHGPSVAEAMAELSPGQAWEHLTPGTHSPVELALHIAAWLDIVRRRFTGQVVTPTTADDWPKPPSPGAEGWSRCRDGVMHAHAALDEALAGADDRELTELIPGQDNDIYYMLHGAVQHSIYHAGQMQLIARALQTGQPG